MASDAMGKSGCSKVMEAERSAAILIVEDEILIRMMAVDVATDCGCRVLEAANASEAMNILSREQQHVSLLFTDIDMPGDQDGLALAWTVAERWPFVTLAVTSGKVRPERDALPPDSIFLPKPYSIDNLTQLFASTRC